MKRHFVCALLPSNRRATPSRRLGDYWSVLTKHRLAARLVSVILAFSYRSFAHGPTDLADGLARQSPDWLASGVIYEIFPREFSPEGNLKGVTTRLDDLKNTGVTILWLMPIQPSGQLKKKGTLGSPYAVRDYYSIDPKYGTKDEFRQLVEEAHRRKMKVIIDIVANHTSWDNVMMIHPDFYKHDKNGQIISPYNWTDVAALDYSNPRLRRYMTDMLVYWIKDFDLDGYRCDAAGEIPTAFWEEAREELFRVKPDLILLAEASKPELLRNAFDIDYSWPLMKALNNVFMHGEPASTLRTSIEQQKSIYPKGALHMRISDDHDEERAITRYGSPGSLAASALLFTIDGVPLLYNGMEAGDVTESAGPALFEPFKIFWRMTERRPQFVKFYSEIMTLRSQHLALQQGELVWVHNSDEQHILTYVRRSGEEEFLVAVNLSNTPFRGTVELSAGRWKEVQFPTSSPGQAGVPALALDAFEFRIFQKEGR